MNFVGMVAALLLALAPPGDTVKVLVDSGSLSELRWPDFRDYRKHVTALYAPRDYALLWTQNGKPTAQATAVLARFAAADAKGLRALDYDADRWPERIAHLATANDLARFDVALSVTLMRYISDLHIGRINPRRLDFALDVDPKKYRLDALLTQLHSAPDVGPILDDVEPHFAGYRRALAALDQYRKLAAAGDQPALPVVRIVEPGQPYAGLAQLVAFLRRVGDLPANAPASDNYDGAAVEAVKRFQRRHGLGADGRIGPATFAQLNVPLSRRMDQIRWTLERWRWAPAQFEEPPIVVNIPEFRLRAYDGGGKEALAMNVIVGRAYRSETPVFADSMEYVVFRPYWNVPPSIQRKEIAPKIAADWSYARKHRFEIVAPNGRVVETVNASVVAGLRSLRYTLRELPGPTNSLGAAKFIFPNEANVYLHDTPARALFSQSQRDFSHGCVRVESPAALAEWVLRRNPGWNRQKIDAAMAGPAQNVQVNLQTRIPVLIVYATVVATEDGEVYFFDDVYGHDARLEDALAAGYPYPG